MSVQPQRIGVAAITENLLKRKWSSVILRHLHQGLADPAEITKVEPNLSPKVISERLRTMVRYGLIVRHPQPAPSDIIEYHLTPLGTKILEMIDCINALDEEVRQGRFAPRANSHGTSDKQGHPEWGAEDSSNTAQPEEDLAGKRPHHTMAPSDGRMPKHPVFKRPSNVSVTTR